ncbi:MAG: hypothetical protein U9Q12_01365 [Patescibacteria group bacterium]|nr:hypothetical protein [Patescibacteria group bacterium]
MVMNLRENKLDQFDINKKQSKSLFGRTKKTHVKSQQKKLKQPQQKKKIQAPQQKKIQQSQQPLHEKWVRKKPKPPLPEEKLDYQEDVPYKKEYSQYIGQQRENVLVHWRGPDFERYPHSKRWYTWISLAVAAIIFYALWTDSIIMAIVFVLIWLVGYLQLSQQPKVIDFAVTYDGILVGDEMYPFEEIKSFWIFYEPPHTRIISLRMKGHLRPYLHIPLHQIDPVLVHEGMIEFIPEERQEQSGIDVVERLLNM